MSTTLISQISSELASSKLNPTRLKRLFRRVSPNPFFQRRFHLFCIGAAKTGTTSVSRMFERHYISAHEPETVATVRQVIAYLEHTIDDSQLRSALLARDRRLKLEVESSHPLGYLSPVLVTTFPKARFIVTVREPYDWLGSRLNYHIRAHPPQWREYRDYFWNRRHVAYAPEEQVLEDAGALSLDTYLSQYADHYGRVFSSIPVSRRLIVKTQDLSQSFDAIASFAEISPIQLHRCHTKRAPKKINLLARMPESYVREKIWNHCHTLIRQYFPTEVHRYLE